MPCRTCYKSKSCKVIRDSLTKEDNYESSSYNPAKQIDQNFQILYGRIPEHDPGPDALEDYYHQTDHHVRGAQALFLPQFS